MNNIKYLESNEKKYPLLFSLNVMEQIQEKYGDFDKWSNLIEPNDGSMPNLAAVIDTFYYALNDGIDFINYSEDKNEPSITRKQAGYIISSLELKEVAKTLTELVTDSTKDDHPKNV